MQIAFHIGVHATDGDRLLKALLKNRGWLLKNQTEIVPPGRHRGLFEEALTSLNGGAATDEMEQIMLDAVLDSENPERVIFSSPSFMGAPGRAVTKGGLYGQMARRVAALSNLFPSAKSEFFVAIRNPATLICDVLQQFSGGDYETLMQGHIPQDLRWRNPIQQVIKMAQGRRIVIWCHEDVPLIWPEVLRLIARMPPDAPLQDAMVYIDEIIDDSGKAELQKALAGRDQLSIAQRRSIYADILSRHAAQDSMFQNIDLPGWTQDLVDQVTENYHADVAEIAVLPGVEFVFP